MSRNNGRHALQDHEAERLIEAVRDFAKKNLKCSDREAWRIARNARKEIEAYLSVQADA